MEPMTTDEILRLYPPTTRARGLARRKADDEVFEKYPEMHVAYIDEWNGDELTRTVVAAHADWAEYERQLAALPAETRARVTVDFVRASDAVFVGAAF
jgi:SRSO17 transposase